MTSIKINETIKALKYSMRGIEFGEVLLISHKKPLFLPKDIKFKYITQLKSIDDFNYNMVYELGGYIETEYALIVHYDGFVVNPNAWDNKFLNYDYIGSPWPLPPENNKSVYRDIYGNVCRVGNSVSIRSKKLLDFPKQENIEWIGEEWNGKIYHHEDAFICCKIRHLLYAAGMEIAPLELAAKFGHEHMIPEIEGITPFVFHKWRGTNRIYPNFEKRKLITKIIIKIRGGV